MKLRGIDFGPVVGASGVQGFFGEGYRYHRLFKMMFPMGFNFEGMTFVGKTMTLNPRKGNMRLGPDGITPLEWLPDCIYVTPGSWRRGIALNAVGLSNPGARFILETSRLQARTDNFFISFMAVEETAQGRLEELKKFVALLRPYLKFFHGKVGLQQNFSCPNIGLHTEHLVEEMIASLEAARSLGIIQVPKINLLVRPKVIAPVLDHPCCDAICVSNTLPWGSLPEWINWKELFGTDVSPLAHLGGGGLSGAPLFPLLVRWIEEAQGIVKKPVIAGGGILGKHDVIKLAHYHNLVPSLGSIAFLRPWRVRSTIKTAESMFP